MDIVNLKKVGGWLPLSRAVLTVGGVDYQDWETVQVRKAISKFPNNTFRFTCSEDAPTPEWSGFRIKPGMDCTITMDGEVAITGIVVTRQVFYNATQHVVEIQGYGKSGKGTAGIKSKTGEFKNIDLQGLASALFKQVGVNVKGGGGQKFDRASVSPGQSIYSMVEQFARSAGKFLSEDSQGNLVIGDMGGGGSAVIEGWNILEGREIIHSTAAAGEAAGRGGGGGGAGAALTALGQAAGKDGLAGAEAYRRNAQMGGGGFSGFSAGNMAKVVLNEIPAFTQKLLQNRGGMENAVDNGDSITVIVTTLGWQRNGYVPPSGGLWETRDRVSVYSPMLIMNGEPLILKVVTFTQNNSTGTRSTIELVNERALKEGGSDA